MSAHHLPYSILVIDDHPLFRKGAQQLFALDRDFELIGEATNGEQGVALALELQPDIVLLDLNMKGMNGIEVLRALKDAKSDFLVIVLTVSNAEDDLVTALRNGADGYLLKDMEPEEILVKLHRAANGDIVLGESISTLLARILRGENQAPTPTDARLTDREQEILALIAAGMSNKLIARKLDISDGTVKVHVKNLLRKLKVRSRLEAAVWAIENGMSRRSTTG